MTAGSSGPRELLKLAVQHPDQLDVDLRRAAGQACSAIPPTCRSARSSELSGEWSAHDDAWMRRLSDAAPDDSVRSVINELAVEPIQVDEAALDRYAREQLGRARERVLTLQIDELRSKMQRLESEDPGRTLRCSQSS